MKARGKVLAFRSREPVDQRPWIRQRVQVEMNFDYLRNQMQQFHPRWQGHQPMDDGVGLA